jgi:isopenicillin N synthase-like dioxygenase
MTLKIKSAKLWQILDEVLEQAKVLFQWKGKTSLTFDREKFVGYSLNAETTHGHIDQKEMFDWATETPGLTIHRQPWEQLRGSSIWPLDSAVPGFRSSMEAFEVFASGIAIEVLRIMGLLPLLDLYKDGEQQPQHRMKLVHYPQLTGSSSQGCGPHTDRAEWLTIIHECGEAALEVEIDNRMVPVPPKPNHVIVIFGQPLEDCSAKAFTAGRHQVVVSRSIKILGSRLTFKALGERGPLCGNIFHVNSPSSVRCRCQTKTGRQ